MNIFEEIYTALLQEARSRRPKPKPMKRKAKARRKKAFHPYEKPKWFPESDWNAIHYKPHLGTAARKPIPVMPNAKIAARKPALPAKPLPPHPASI